MSLPLAKLITLPQGVQTATDYRLLAEARLSADTWQYLERGSGNGITLRENLLAFEQAKLMTRPLVNVKAGHTKLSLFGQQYEHPFILAPVAYQRLFHPDGECASAMGANAQSGQMIISSLASQSLEEMITAADQPLWFQLYWQGSRERSLKLVKRALAAGYNAVMMTVDAPVKQATMILPDGIHAVNLEAPLTMPALAAGQSDVFDGWMTQAATWDDIDWLRNQVSEPLLIKGILHADDAEKVLQLGADGVVVSNHGGRVLDGVPSSLEVLAEVVKRLSGKATVLFDSGIRSGQDAYKALMLGADAVLVGRPYIWGLSSCGAMGVAHVLRIMRDELEMTMALSGVSQLAEIRLQRV